MVDLQEDQAQRQILEKTVQCLRQNRHITFYNNCVEESKLSSLTNYYI